MGKPINQNTESSFEADAFYSQEGFLTPTNPNVSSFIPELPEGEAIELRREYALYIERMVGELCIMSSRAEMNFLSYLLDMARIEASDRARDTKLPQVISNA